MRTTYFRDADTTVLTFEAGDSRHSVPLRMVAPAQVERSTGSLRAPELMVDLPATLVGQLNVDDHPAPRGPVVGVLVHLVTQRAAAVGTFDSADRAIEWWAQPFNRLAQDRDMLFLLAAPAEREAASQPS